MEGWYWIRDTQLHEDALLYRGNGTGIIATLRPAALKLSRLAGCSLIRAGIQAEMQAITALLAMVRRRPEPGLDQDLDSTLDPLNSCRCWASLPDLVQVGQTE
jgi:hypothetical protein